MTVRFFKNTLFLSVLLATTTLFASFGHAQGVVRSPQNPLDPNQMRAVVITDPVVLQNFTLTRTVGQIVATGGKTNNDANRQKFINSLIISFTKTEKDNAKLPMPITNRPGEAALLPANLLNPNDLKDGMKPVALTNRLDLMPSDGSNCGEQRIIYEKNSGLNSGGDRLTLIFEAVIDNPTPSLGMGGCVPIAKFWNDLTSFSLSQATIATRLENFFYKGIMPNEPVTLVPPVHFLHYGNPLGQVRVNLFVNAPEWMLREYRTQTGNRKEGVTLRIETDENSAWRILYEPSSPGDSAEMQQRKFDCQKDFATRDFRAVTSVEAGAGAAGSVTDQQLIMNMGMDLRDKCSSFENNSSNPFGITSILDPFLTLSANPELGDAVESALSASISKWPYPLTSDFIINRFNIQSCAGCHELTNRVPIAPISSGGIAFWPPSLGFVHIDERGRLSELLTNNFLPGRFTLLQSLIQPLGGAKTPSGVETASSSATVAAANDVLALQQKILQGTLSDTAQESQIEQIRETERSKFGALIKNRPTH